MKLKKIIFSTKTTSLLFLLLIFSMALATFLEQKYSTDVAKIFIYESTWFEIIISIIIINLIGNIWKYKLWNKKKFPIFIFHLSFIIIFIGGILSRYYSYEGIVSIREGETVNKILSKKNYIKLKINQGNHIQNYYEPYTFSTFHDDYKGQFIFKKNPIKIKFINYIPCAKIIISREKKEEKIVKIVLATQRNGRIEDFIRDGEEKMINGLYFSLNKKNPLGIQIFDIGKKVYIKSFFPVKSINMITGKNSYLSINKPHLLNIRELYQIEVSHNKKINIVIPDGIIKGKLKYVPCDKNETEEKNTFLSAFTVKIFFHNQSKLVTFLGGNNTIHMSNPIMFNDNCNISIGYGSIFFPLSFSLKLNKFKLENYPGSSFPSLFMSNITILDKEKSYKYLVYMNKILDYKGYRFFQSGYDPDGKGSHFSVNNDYLGMYFSYFGYILMSIGMSISLFWKGTRFSFLKERLKKYIYSKKNFFIIFFLMGINYSFSQIHESRKIPLNSIYDVIHIPKKHGDNFGRLLVQDDKGRIKAINTLAIELLRKVHKKNSIANLDANQWFISIHQDNLFWTKIPFIKADSKGGLNFLKKINANRENYVSMMDLYSFDPKSKKIKFILQEDYETAFSKNPMHRNEYDKSVLLLSERIGIIHEIFQGKYLRIFPIPNDVHHTWSSWIILNPKSNKKLNPYGLSMFNDYLKSLFRAQNEKDWRIADQEIEKIRLYQIKYAKSILPTDRKISVEIIYNKANIFYILSFLYPILGLIIILNSFLSIFFKNIYISIICKISIIFVSVLFFFQLLGLISRYYISGHAPWSNGYESAIFISWCLICIGFLFYKNQFVLGITSLISSILLMIAHGSMMDPEITNLVPVLKSNWLIIHVATITSSYGFFFTGSFLGFLVFILYILNGFCPSYKNIIKTHIEQLTIINEICLIIGIFLLTIGTFLGAVWANNSWGRYWSWDPKETWALISIMVYAFILHMRLIPSFRGTYSFNFFSILSVSSIIMTYFGVNYYLSGLHSYAKGDPVSIPYWIYYSIFIFIIVSFLAYYSRNKNNITT
ncbi:cytochrome c biogenesis protein CcsA [Blattabacterium cuenoti]|uniref:cytochrome c biogenesis protein CcsA n=1 Tax=Blattabacterium cuenoti TaxID=1653831 RepID=UPI00163CDFBA|nr:cytochrome c biogenesis protein CcsA [Blattabacterium cuenoti]